MYAPRAGLNNKGIGMIYRSDIENLSVEFTTGRSEVRWSEPLNVSKDILPN